MADPVYVLYIMKAKEAYFQLCEKNDHTAWWKEWMESSEQAGGESIIGCYGLEPTAYMFGVTKYKDMESFQKAQVIVKGNKVMRYFDITTHAGMVHEEYIAMANALGVGKKE
jgi:hypothetical protein